MPRVSAASDVAARRVLEDIARVSAAKTIESIQWTDFVIGKAARLGVPHLGVVVHAEWRLAVRADVGFEALADQLGSGDGGVKGLVGYAKLSSWP